MLLKGFPPDGLPAESYVGRPSGKTIGSAAPASGRLHVGPAAPSGLRMPGPELASAVAVSPVRSSSIRAQLNLISGVKVRGRTSIHPAGAVLTLIGGTPVVSVSSSKVVTPAGAVLELVGGTPVVSTPTVVSPAAASLALAGGTPSVVVDSPVRPTGASLTLTGGTPTVLAPRLVEPAGASLSLVGGTPAVSVGTVVAPSPASLTLTGGAPVVTATDNRLAQPTGASLTLTGGTPVVSVTDHKTVTPTGASLTLTGGTPVVSTPVVASPSGAALALTGGTPTVLTPRLVLPNGATLVLTGGTPVVSTPRLVQPTGASLTLTGGTPTVTVASAGAAVKGASAVAATSITIPAHSVGDVIVIYAFRRSTTTQATVPTAAGTVPTWTQILATAGTTSAARSHYCVATATNHTSGTWTNADALVAVVISGANASPIGGNAAATGGSSLSTTPPAPAVTLVHTDGTSVLLHFYAPRAATSASSPPAGYTQQALAATPSAGLVFVNSKDSTTSDGSVSNTVSPSSIYQTQTIEIKT